MEFASPLRHDAGTTGSGSVSGCGPAAVATECPEPLCPKRALPASGRPPGRLEGRYPLVVAHTGSCARPSPSPRLGLRLARRVFAGCRQSLLRDGPSRHYLRDPCVGARTPTPPRSLAALVRFFARDSGLTPEETGSARESTPTQQLRGEPNFEAAVIRSPSGSYACSAPRLLPPRQRTLPGGRAFHTTHRPAGYPNRDVALLHARHGQLA